MSKMSARAAPPRKRRKVSAIAEINFDFAEREEYLTGFHKRKQERIKAAQTHAEKQAKERRVRERKELRDQRKADLEQHVKDVRKIMRQQANPDDPQAGSSSEEGDADEVEWQGMGEEEPVNREDEYIDEDKFTTVTIEEVEVDRDGLHTKAVDMEPQHKDKDAANKDSDRQRSQDYPKHSQKDRGKKEKLRKKKIPYESKGERKANRQKEKAKNSKRAAARRKR